MSRLQTTEIDTLRARAEALHLHGLLTHWTEVATQPWPNFRSLTRKA